jgi:FtsH-binding integral membrane protein
MAPRYHPAVVAPLTWGLMLLVGGYGVAAVVLTIMARAPREYLVIASAVLSAAVVAMALVAVGFLVAGERPDELGTFLGYLLVAVVLLPLGTLWALAERSRWGTGVLAVVCFTLLVVLIRLQDLWSTTGG